MQNFYTEGQIQDVVRLRLEKDPPTPFEKIAKHLEKQYGLSVTTDACRALFHRHKDEFALEDAKVSLKLLQESARVKKMNSLRSKENRIILEALNNQQDLLDSISGLIDRLPIPKPFVQKKKSKKSLTPMTIEVMSSDIHVGKKSKTFDFATCRKRHKELAETVLEEIDRHSDSHCVEKIVWFLGGDIIENSLMHGSESMSSCEFQNPEQLVKAIETLYEDLLLTLAGTGIDIDVICVAGNHDRQEENKTFNLPGKNSLAWVIYNTLKILSKRIGLYHVRWFIPEEVFHVHKIYNSHILYEHGDNVKGTTRDAFNKHIANRSTQTGVLISGLRIGHWHEPQILDEGRVIVNGSLCGQDSYTETNGYNSKPSQMVNFYCPTKKRDNSYYHSFLVQL